jgi:hypothetical protein
MAEHAQRTFARGWMPDADAVNAPADALLRADNLILDELGVLALRQGSAKINIDVAPQLDVHSLFTIIRNGTRLQYAAGGGEIYRNGNVNILGGTMAGTGDVSFGSYLGQTFFARSTSKFKDDGTTVRNWGIAMTGGIPTVTDPIEADFREFATWDIEETADHAIEEDDGAGLAYDDGHDGDPEGAVVIIPSTSSGRAIVTRTFPLPEDFSTHEGGREMTLEDILTVYMFSQSPNLVRNIILQIDVNDGTFQTDVYRKEWPGAGSLGTDRTVEGGGGAGEIIDPGPDEPILI